MTGSVMLRDNLRFLAWAIIFTLALFGASMLAGCQAAKTVYDACMDGHCR
jgi:hypothetical protein